MNIVKNESYIYVQASWIEQNPSEPTVMSFTKNNDGTIVGGVLLTALMRNLTGL